MIRSRLLPLLLLPALPALAGDTLVLDDGRRVQVDSWWEDARTIMYEKYGGTVGIPKSRVVEILEGDDGSDRRSGPPGARRYGPGITGSSATPTTRSTSATLESLAISMNESPAASPAQELQVLEDRLRSHPGDQARLARPMAALLTARGNGQLRSGDIDAALADYERAEGLDPTLMPARINRAVALLAQGRNGEALSQVNGILAANADQPDALFLRGEALYRDDRMEEAIRTWERVEQIAPSPRTQERLAKARREHEVGGEYETSAAAHFLLRYDGKRADARLSREILDFLEAQFNRMVSRYNVLPESVIVVIFYPITEFHQVTQTTARTAGLFDGKIRVPIAGATALTDQMRDTLLHELTHSFIFAKTRGNCPAWLQEGLAQHEEGRRASSSTLSGLATGYRSRSAGWGTEIDYDAALALTQFLIGRYGLGQVLAVLDRLRQGSTEDQAIRGTFGMSMEEMLRSWGDYLVRGGTS